MNNDMMNAYLIGFTAGMVAGLGISILAAFLLYTFRATINKTVAAVAKLSPSERGSFIASEDELQANKKKTWS